MNTAKKLPQIQGPTIIIIAAILWGIDGILRRQLYALPPSVIVFYEHLIGVVIIAPFLFGSLRGVKLKARDLVALSWVALLSGVLGTLFFTAALIKVQYITISVVYLLQKLQPIFAIAAAALLLKEKITTKYMLWAAIALVAAYFVTFPDGRVIFQTGDGTAKAAFLALAAAFCWGSSTAVSRYALKDLPATAATGLRFLITVPLAFVMVGVTDSFSGLTAISTADIIRLIIIALTTGMVALWIYYRGLQITQVKIATLLELFFPLTAVVLDYVYYGTVLHMSQYVAGVVLLYAAYRVSQLNSTSSQ